MTLNDTKTRLSFMTRHGSYWNNIIITRVATSFFRVNLRQGRHRIRLYICSKYDCLYDIWYGIFEKKRLSTIIRVPEKSIIYSEITYEQ